MKAVLKTTLAAAGLAVATQAAAATGATRPCGAVLHWSSSAAAIKMETRTKRLPMAGPAAAQLAGLGERAAPFFSRIGTGGCAQRRCGSRHRRRIQSWLRPITRSRRGRSRMRMNFCFTRISPSLCNLEKMRLTVSSFRPR